MTIDGWLLSARQNLKAVSIDTARLDSLILLEFVIKKNRSWILAHPDFKLAKSQVDKLNKLIDQRTRHEPIAYIVGKTEFYGREFMVNHHVLEPRPESEAIVDQLKSHCASATLIVDVGTGSGALAITAKLELPDSAVIATDIDDNCLKVARQNAKKLATDISFYKGDLLDPLPTSTYDTQYSIIANLPYVPDNFHINPAALNEPRLAIFGGPDGLGLYRKLFGQIDALQNQPQFVLTESMPPQHSDLAKIASYHGYQLALTDDFIQVFATK